MSETPNVESNDSSTASVSTAQKALADPTDPPMPDRDGGPDDRRVVRKWTDAPRRTVLWLIAVFAALEAIGVFSIPAQVGLTALVAFLCVNLAIFGYRTNRTAGVVMAAVLTTRLVTLTLPANDISVPTRAGIVAFATIIISYVATWVLSWDINAGRMDEGFVLRKPIRSARFTGLLTMLTGFPIGAGVYFALRPDEIVVQPLFGAVAVAWGVAVVLLGASALGEELVYRRLVAAMVQHTGRSQAPWPAALIYASAFIGTQNPLMVALAFVAGLVWSWSCERTGAVEPVVVAHIITTVIALVLLPAIY